MNNIISEIGLPALLEQLAEECGELTQASLKLARFIRKENPTPKTRIECVTNLTEEIADVKLCIELLMADEVIDKDKVDSVADNKKIRWSKRLKEANSVSEE